MDGNAITLFAATPQAGSLKLPDLSLALGFEHRLGLDGGKATAGKLVQTAQITPLRDSVDTMRFCREVKIKAKRVSAPRRGTEGDRVAYSADTVRIMRDEGNYYLLAIPKYARYKYGRDLLFAPGSESVAVHTYRCVAEGGTRARDRSRMEEEQLDFNKITGLARDGRVYLYSLDVGGDRWLFDAVYSTENKSPCRIVPTIPQLFQLGSAAKTCPSRKQNGMNIITDVPVDDEVAVAKIMFVFNPTVPRDGRKRGGRSWKAYCDAHPDDAGREAVVWPTGEATEKTLRESTLRVVEADGVLLTDESHLDAALDGMGYVVTQTDDPHGIGGVYRGYIISDRVFKLSDGRDEWRAAVKGDTKPDGKAQEKEKRLQMSGKPLCGVLSSKVAAEAEKEFSKLIEAEVLSDKKTARFFTLEAPIVIGKEFKDMVSREFRRVVYTGTMGWRKQLVRPSHEVALGIWLARLSVSTGAGKS